MADQFYIVKKEVVPNIYTKVIEAKKLLQSGTAHSINEAVEIVGISRGAFYKYKDNIFLEYELGKKSIATLSVTVQNKPGVLSKLLNIIAERMGNVLTINQNIPIHDIANVTITFEVEPEMNLENLIITLKDIEGVNEAIVLARQ